MRIAFFFCIGLVCLQACNPSSHRNTLFQQYYVKGKFLYVQHCSNCHQKNGTGLGLVYPPLAQSDFMDQQLQEVLCLMKYGQSGKIIVNGKKYNQEMKGIFSLTDLEIAEIATYIYNTWEHEKGIIAVSDVSKTLQKCNDH